MFCQSDSAYRVLFGTPEHLLCFENSKRFGYLSETMTDPRYTKLADLLVNYSTALKKGDRILLDMIDVPDEFTIELIRAVRAAGAAPFVETRHTRVGRELLRDISEAQAAQVRDI